MTRSPNLCTCGDSPEPLLTSCIPNLQLNPLSIKLNCSYLKVNTGAAERRKESSVKQAKGASIKQKVQQRVEYKVELDRQEKIGVQPKILHFQNYAYKSNQFLMSHKRQQYKNACKLEFLKNIANINVLLRRCIASLPLVGKLFFITKDRRVDDYKTFRVFKYQHIPIPPKEKAQDIPNCGNETCCEGTI